VLEIVNVVVAALAAGAAVGVTDTASTAVKETYQGLKLSMGKLMRRRLGADDAELEKQLADPRSHQDVLAAALEGAAEDEREQLKAAAERLLGLVGATEQRWVVRDSPGSVFGPQGTVTNNNFYRG